MWGSLSMPIVPVVVHPVTVVVDSTPWWQTLIIVLGAIAGALLGAYYAGRLAAKRAREAAEHSARLATEREIRFRREGIRVEWLRGLQRSSMAVFYGARIAFMVRTGQPPGVDPRLVPHFSDAEWRSVEATGELVMFGGRVGSEAIKKAAEDLMARADSVRAVADDELNNAWQAMATAFDVMRDLLASEIERILEGNAA